MKKWIYLLAAVLLLSGCQTVEVQDSPEPEPLDVQQAAAQWLSNDGHHAFFVNGHVVTVERAAAPAGDCSLVLTVWDREDPDVPVQTIPMAEDVRFHGDKGLDPAWSRVEDFNFDGWEDFACLYAMGNQPVYYHVWLWDPQTGQYVYEPAFDEISYPEVDWEEEKITGWAVGGSAGAVGDYAIYQWIDGALTEVRHIKLDYEDYEDLNSHYLSITDWIDGEMKEVFRLEGGGWMEAVEPWLHLSYGGEESNP